MGDLDRANKLRILRFQFRMMGTRVVGEFGVACGVGDESLGLLEGRGQRLGTGER